MADRDYYADLGVDQIQVGVVRELVQASVLALGRDRPDLVAVVVRAHGRAECGLEVRALVGGDRLGVEAERGEADRTQVASGCHAIEQIEQIARRGGEHHGPQREQPIDQRIGGLLRVEPGVAVEAEVVLEGQRVGEEVRGRAPPAIP